MTSTPAPNYSPGSIARVTDVAWTVERIRALHVASRAEAIVRARDAGIN